MVVLSKRTEGVDALNVLAAERREFVFSVTTSELLRKPRTRHQVRRLALLRAEARRQVTEQLSDQARRSFRGRVAVQIRLTSQTGRNEAGLGRVIKDYVDLLKGVVVFDDARIDHLLVRRESSTAGDAVAAVRCLPISVFAAEYDRAFKVLGERAVPRVSTARFRDGAPIAQMPPWGLRRFDDFEQEALLDDERMLDDIRWVDQQEADAISDDPDGLLCDLDLDLGSLPEEFADWQLRGRMRDELADSIAFRRGTWLTDHGFEAWDRAGAAPSWLEETVASDLADIEKLREDGPGCFFLSAPPTCPTASGEMRWPAQIEREFSRGLTGGWLQSRFGGPVAFDIALRGHAGLHTDVDNLAHVVMAAFGRAFGPLDAPVGGYRVYRQLAASRSDIRVRLIPAIRLDVLAAAMDEARMIVRRTRSERARQADAV